MNSTVPSLDSLAPDSAGLWAMYRHALSRASLARDLLRARLARGVPARLATTSGEPWAEAAIAQSDVAALIDRYCRADKALEDAARTLVDCLELRDDGKAEGVQFTLAMAPRTTA